MKPACQTTGKVGAGLILAALLAAPLVGCVGHPLQRKLSGRWLGDRIENVEGERLAAATGWVKGTSFEFAGSTLTVAIPAEEPRSGRYRVVRVNQDAVKLAVTDTSGKSDEIDLKLDDERSMRWMLGEGRAIVMRREY